VAAARLGRAGARPDGGAAVVGGCSGHATTGFVSRDG
jgi:hypothetical protein